MAVFDRCNVRVVAVGAGLCGVAIALGPGAAAAPWATGGYECVQDKTSGTAAAAGAPACAPLNDMAGVPMAVPGPLPAAPPAAVPPVPAGVPPVPVAPPVPAPPLPAAPVPVGAPIAAAPAMGGAPLTDMGGSNYGGKGQPTGPLPPGAPVPGQPVPAGPTGAR